jgi:hypothetical protein
MPTTCLPTAGTSTVGGGGGGGVSHQCPPTTTDMANASTAAARTVCTIRMMFSVLIFRFPSDRGGWPKPGCEAQKTPSVKAGGPFRRCGYSLRRFSTHIRCRRCRDPAWLGNTPRSTGCYTPHPDWPGCSSCTAAAAKPMPPGPAPHSGPQCPQAVILALVMSPSTELTPPSAVGRRECSGSGRLL